MKYLIGSIVMFSISIIMPFIDFDKEKIKRRDPVFKDRDYLPINYRDYRYYSVGKVILIPSFCFIMGIILFLIYIK